MYFPCDKFIRILIKNAQYDLYDSRSPSFWFHVAREITLVKDRIGPFIDQRSRSLQLGFHYKHTLPHCHWWHLLFFSSNSRKKKWLREAGKLLSVWMKAVSRKKRLTVSVFSLKYFYNCNLQSSLSYRFGSRLGHSHPPAKHEGPRLCIYLCRYMWTLAHMLQLGAVYSELQNLCMFNRLSTSRF